MEQVESWGGKRIYSGAVYFAGRLEDYVNPTGGVARVMSNLLAEYAREGGDLEMVQLTCSVEKGTKGRSNTVVRLHGYSL